MIKSKFKHRPLHIGLLLLLIPQSYVAWVLISQIPMTGFSGSSFNSARTAWIFTQSPQGGTAWDQRLRLNLNTDELTPLNDGKYVLEFADAESDNTYRTIGVYSAPPTSQTAGSNESSEWLKCGRPTSCCSVSIAADLQSRT